LCANTFFKILCLFILINKIHYFINNEI